MRRGMLVLFCACLLCGCQRGQGETPETDASGRGTSAAAQTEETSAGIMTEEEYANYVESCSSLLSGEDGLHTGDNSFIFLDGTVYYTTGYHEESNNNSVVLKTGFSIYSYDCATGKNRLCKNAEGSTFFDGNVYVRGLWTLNGKLYLLHLQEEDWYLCEADPSDFSLKPVCRVCGKEELVPESWRDGLPGTFSYMTGVCVWLHGGYVYAVSEQERILRIRMEEGAEPEVLYQAEEGEQIEVGPVIGGPCFSGNRVVFYECGEELQNGRLRCLSLDSGEAETVAAGNGTGIFTVTEQQEVFFWKSGEGIVRYSCETGKMDLFCSASEFGEKNMDDQLFYDGKFLYYYQAGDGDTTEEDARRRVYLISMEGKVLATIEFQNDGEFTATKDIAGNSRIDWVQNPYGIFGQLCERVNADAYKSVLDKKALFTEDVEKWVQVGEDAY